LTGFSLLDWITLIFFGLAWFGYEFVVDRTAVRHRSLNVLINEERHHWMQEISSSHFGGKVGESEGPHQLGKGFGELFTLGRV